MLRPRHRAGEPWSPAEKAAYYRTFIDSHRNSADQWRAAGQSHHADALDGLADDRQPMLDRLVEEHGDGLEGVWVGSNGRFEYDPGFADELGGGW
jgi:hypothetical protein